MGILEHIGLFEGKDKEFKLYVDMDGVLTDFEGDFRNFGKEKTKGLLSKEYEDKYGTSALWKLIYSGGLEFWSEMSWIEDGRKLWNYVKKFEPTILTTPAKSKLSKQGKEIWIKRELGKDIPFIFAKDKYKYADMNSILIDDYDKKINDWINLGDGIGIHHQNAENTIKQLKQFGF
jgi:hypothetical protein